MRMQPNTLRQLSPLGDEEVALRVVAGDTGAFELLMRRHNQRLFRTARSVLSNDADAQDALQDAYIRVYRGLPRFRERSTLVTWMTRIVFNEALRFRARRSGIRQRERAAASLAATNARAGGPEPVMDETERMRMFDDALGALSERERAVVMLRIVQGLGTRETAASLGMSESHVKVCLFRAKPKMADALAGSGAEEVRRRLSFDGARCDRLVAAVFQRLEQQSPPPPGARDDHFGPP